MTLFDEERPITRVQWTLGNQCNYSCTYCHEMFRRGDRPFPSEELIAEVCKDIVYYFDEIGRDVEFEFIGGEPTLSGDIREIGKRLHNHPVNIILKTNGSASLEWWANAKKYLSKVIISVHKDFCNLSHITDVVSLLLEDQESHPINVEILIPTTQNPEHWQWAVSALQLYREKFALGNLQMLYSNFARGSDVYYPYSESQWKQYAQLHGLPIPKSVDPNNKLDKYNTVDLKIRDPLDFNGAKCYSGIDTLVIDYNGRVWRGWCSHGGPIGSIYELPIQFPTEPIICNLPRCGNGFDQQSRKEVNYNPAMGRRVSFL